jgi:hypothetical protein
VTPPQPPTFGGKGDAPRRSVRVNLEIGVELRIAGRLDEAIDVLARALEGARDIGDIELQLAVARELGLTLLAASHLAEAEVILDRVLQETAEHYGEDGPQWATAAEELALARRARGDLQGALVLQRGAYQASVRSLGRKDPVTLALGQNAKVADRSRWPLPLLLSFTRPEPDAEWPRELPDLFLRTSLSEPLWSGGKQGYFRILTDVLREEQSEPLHVVIYFAQSVLGRALTSVPDYEMPDEGVDLARYVFQERSATLGPDHPQTLNSMVLLAHAFGARDAASAIEVGWEGARHTERVLGRGHIDTLGAYESLANMLDAWGDKGEAGRLREINLALRTVDKGILGSDQPPIENIAGTLTEPLTRPDHGARVGLIPVGFGHGLGGGAPILIESPSEPGQEGPNQAAAARSGNFEEGLREAVEGGSGEASESSAASPWPADESAEPKVRPTGELVRRTAHVELDPARPIQPGDKFDVAVYVDCAALGDEGTGELAMKPPPGVTNLTLRAWLVVSRHFTSMATQSGVCRST